MLLYVVNALGFVFSLAYFNVVAVAGVAQPHWGIR